MDIGSIFLILAILIPVVLYIGRPLFERRVTSPIGSDQNLSTLLAERDQIVSAIKELDDDYNLGKIPAEIYPSQRLTLLQGGVEILQQIDARNNQPPSEATKDRLESAIVSHREALGVTAPSRKNGNAVPPVPDDELEQKIASHRRQLQVKGGGFCPKCGKPVHDADRFCPKCGAKLD